MATYTVKQLAQAAYNAGFRGPDLLIAIAVSLAENPAHDTNATNHNTNGTVDRGAWQINSVHNFSGNPYDLQENANMAYAVVHHGGGWNAWTTYRDGAYKHHLARAQRAGAHTFLNNFGDNVPGIQNPVTALGDANLPNPIGGVTDAAHAVGNVASHLLSPGFWRMVGIGAVALALLVFGFILMAESNKDIRKATEMAAVA